MKSEPKKRTPNEALVDFLNRIINAVLGFLHLTAYKEQILYLVVGGGTTVVDWAVFTLLVLVLPDLSELPFFAQFPTAIPYTVGWAAAVLFAYWASRAFVFEKAEKEPIRKQFPRFVASRLFTLAVSLLGDFVLTGKLGMNEFLAKAIISILVIILNYVTSKLFVFRTKKPAPAEPTEETESESHD